MSRKAYNVMLAATMCGLLTISGIQIKESIELIGQINDQHSQILQLEEEAKNDLQRRHESQVESLTAFANSLVDKQYETYEKKLATQEETYTLAHSALKTGSEALTNSDKKVLNTKNREELSKAHTNLSNQLEVKAPLETITKTTTEIKAVTGKVDEDVKSWEKEQARIAAEREAAQRRAEQTRQAPTQQRYSNTTGNSGTQPAPTRTNPTPVAPTGGGGGGFESQVRGIMARHCPSSTRLSINGPKLVRGANGVADWYNNTIYIRSSMPSYRVPYVVAHECAHIRQYNVYGGNVNNLQNRMNQIYGGSGFRGLEQNADCITQAWGYSTYNYTNSCGGARGTAARAIINGQQP